MQAPAVPRAVTLARILLVTESALFLPLSVLGPDFGDRGLCEPPRRAPRFGRLHRCAPGLRLVTRVRHEVALASVRQHGT